MKYSAMLQATGQGFLVLFPELPGLTAQAADRGAARSVAHRVLNEQIGTMLSRGEIPARPRKVRSPEGSDRIGVTVRPDYAVTLQMRWTRQEQGLSLAKVAHRMGVSRQRISALEITGRNWTVGTLLRLSDALDADLEIVLRRRRR
jgi:predicted RNase H-like HicB family nuclease/DNA-binding XRE family transcriptional regulator